MTSVSDLVRLVGVLSADCTTVTQHTLRDPELTGWSEIIEDEQGFQRLVTAAYRWVHELWSTHIAFLVNRAPSTGRPATDTRNFMADLKALRTAHQHVLDPKRPSDARTFSEVSRWYQNACRVQKPASSNDWALCGGQVRKELEGSLRELIGVARAVGKNKAFAEEWTAVFKGEARLDLIGARQAIQADLGLSPTRADEDYLDRRVEEGWRRVTGRLLPGAQLDFVLRQVVVRELTAWSLPRLPCDHAELLERINVESAVQALGLVRLAQALYELVSFDTTEAFLEMVVSAWDFISP